MGTAGVLHVGTLAWRGVFLAHSRAVSFRPSAEDQDACLICPSEASFRGETSRALLRFAAVATLTAGAFVTPLSAAPIANTGKTYYVDFANGNDDNSGVDQAHPWKHAPHASVEALSPSGFEQGFPDPDVNPASVSQSTVLRPGDKVSLKGGVVYYGQISPTALGDAGASGPGNAIYVVGGEWGTGPAVISGSDPVTAVAACPSQAECGGNPNWKKLSVITYNSVDTVPRFFQCVDAECLRTTMLFESQSPAPQSYFFSDDVGSFYKWAPASLNESFLQGSLDVSRDPTKPSLADIFTANGGTAAAKFAIHASPNVVYEKPVTGMEGTTVHFAADYFGRLAGLDPKGPLFAVMNVAYLISAPGQYAYLAQGCRTACTAIAWLPNGALPVLVSGGAATQAVKLNGRDLPVKPRNGILLSPHSGNAPSPRYLSFSGIRLQNFSGYFDLPNSGMGIANAYLTAGTDLTIRNCEFVNFASFNRTAAITSYAINNPTIDGNRISNIQRGTAATIQKADGRESFTDNFVGAIGKTGLDVYGPINQDPATGGASSGQMLITGNVFGGAEGLHGNGISIYPGGPTLNIYNVTLTGNTIANATRPVRWFQGKVVGPNNWLIQGNVITTNAVAWQPLEGAGGSNGVTIRGNLLVNKGTAPWGVMAGSGDTNLSVENNFLARRVAYGLGQSFDGQGMLVSRNQYKDGVGRTPPTWSAKNNGVVTMADLSAVVPRLTDPPGSPRVALPALMCATIKPGLEPPYSVGAQFFCP